MASDVERLLFLVVDGARIRPEPQQRVHGPLLAVVGCHVQRRVSVCVGYLVLFEIADERQRVSIGASQNTPALLLTLLLVHRLPAFLRCFDLRDAMVWLLGVLACKEKKVVIRTCFPSRLKSSLIYPTLRHEACPFSIATNLDV